MGVTTTKKVKKTFFKNISKSNTKGLTIKEKTDSYGELKTGCEYVALRPGRIRLIRSWISSSFIRRRSTNVSFYYYPNTEVRTRRLTRILDVENSLFLIDLFPALIFFFKSIKHRS
jgi:hypothetical protein